MDLVNSCKEKLSYFRIKELKDVLTQLGLSKQGKKQDLVERILAIFSDEQVFKSAVKKNAVGKEQVAKLVDDTYRKMQTSGATEPASKGMSDSSNVKIKGEIEDSLQSVTKIRCLCGSSLATEGLIQCDDTRCQVWQHESCVLIPEKPTDGIPPVPDKFFCEICRLSRADPFLVPVAHPLLPVKLNTTNVPTDGTNPVQSVERSFQLTRADKDLVSKPEFDVQAWCMLLNDKVPFRMQWPQYTDLQVNGVPVRAINRPGSQLLGANGRDDGPIITPYTKDGINKISLTGCDGRLFCLGVRIAKRRTMQQILSIIPKESDGEPFEDALARVCRVGGGNAADNADSDSDLEVVSDTFSINLRCPMSGSRMKVAGRFKPCVHMGCFDLEVFVEMNQRSRKWQCPICLKNYTLENIIIDPYFNRITSKMISCGEDVTEVEVKPDGSWRVKVKSEVERRDFGNLAQWHFPDGSLCVSTDEEVNRVDTFKQIKQEGISDSPPALKLGIRKNHDGVWVFSKPNDTNTSSGNRLKENPGNHEQVVIPMSSSATESGHEGDDPSVNQGGGGGGLDFSNNGMEMDSFYHSNVDSAYGFTENKDVAPTGDAEVIVLSDSEEENDRLVSSATDYKNNQTDAVGVGYAVPPSGIADSHAEDPTLGGLGLFSTNEDEFEMPPSLWSSLPSGTQAGAGFSFFTSDVDVSDALVHLQHGPVNCSASLNGYALAPDAPLGSSTLMPDASVGRSDADLTGGLVDNPLVAFAGDDPSLKIFLPTRPAESSGQHELRDQADVSNGVCNEDWISLRLGGGASGNNNHATTPNGLNSRQQILSREPATDAMADTASLLLGMNDVRSDKATRQRSDSPFSFPRQKRSVRPRLYLSIDSDSE